MPRNNNVDNRDHPLNNLSQNANHHTAILSNLADATDCHADTMDISNSKRKLISIDVQDSTDTTDASKKVKSENLSTAMINVSKSNFIIRIKLPQQKKQEPKKEVKFADYLYTQAQKDNFIKPQKSILKCNNENFVAEQSLTLSSSIENIFQKTLTACISSIKNIDIKLTGRLIYMLARALRENSSYFKIGGLALINAYHLNLLALALNTKSAKKEIRIVIKRMADIDMYKVFNQHVRFNKYNNELRKVLINELSNVEPVNEHTSLIDLWPKFLDFNKKTKEITKLVREYLPPDKRALIKNILTSNGQDTHMQCYNLLISVIEELTMDFDIAFQAENEDNQKDIIAIFKSIRHQIHKYLSRLEGSVKHENEIVASAWKNIQATLSNFFPEKTHNVIQHNTNLKIRLRI